jgi:hypothetical protein
VLNPATPYGDCSLIRMANLHANLLQIAGPAQLRECFAMLTERSGGLLNLPPPLQINHLLSSNGGGRARRQKASASPQPSRLSAFKSIIASVPRLAFGFSG